jgi:two-component system sensor histidine kinase KdpD
MNRRDAVVLLATVVLLGAIAEGLRSLPGVSLVVVAPLFLAVVIGSATLARLRVAIVASVLAALGLNFFFVSPVDTFAIDTPQDGLALAGFLAVAVIASRVSSRARRHARAGALDSSDSGAATSPFRPR